MPCTKNAVIALKHASSSSLGISYFSATWCDWYLADTRPEQSKRCIAGQHYVDALHKDYPKVKITSVVNNLWTEQKDVIEYQQKFKSVIPAKIDDNNQLFSQFKIEQLPVLVALKNGKEIWRKQDFSGKPELPQMLLE